ncbi:MAG: DUF1653 domain-containing protein [Pseudomonadota bacterium]
MEIKKGKYRHFKGNYYEVLDVVRHSETEEKLVLYKQLYADHSLWVRPYDQFVEKVETDGKTIPRFAFVDNLSKLSNG